MAQGGFAFALVYPSVPLCMLSCMNTRMLSRNSSRTARCATFWAERSSSEAAHEGVFSPRKMVPLAVPLWQSIRKEL
jgi:hypothetical protein